jgi:hypothetical protein
MPQAMQGMIIGLLISLLVGIIVGFYLRQSRINELAAALKTSQGREPILQREHEERLRTATAQLQQDYEAQLADKIERYQRQYEAQRQQLEAEYEARQNLVPGSPGGSGVDAQDPNLPAEAWATAPVSEYEAQLRQQYEARLKENSRKIQQAYEQHLRETLAAERDAQQRDYDQRLAEAIARYQDEADARLAEALQEQGLVAQAEGSGQGADLVDETQVQERLATLEAELRTTYDRRLAERIEQYQDEMSQRIAQLEQEFAARLQMAQATQPADEPPSLDLPANADLEARFQSEYDRRLAEAIARHQDEMTERIQALTEDYEARLQMAQGGGDGGDADTPDNEVSLRQQLETELRAEYDLQLAEKLTQVQTDLDQRVQDFQDGLIATMDPFVDTAVDAEALEDEGLDADPFPDLGAEPAAATTFVDDAGPTLGEPGADLDGDVAWADSSMDSADDGRFDQNVVAPDSLGEDPFGEAPEDPFSEDPFGEAPLDVDDGSEGLAFEDAGFEDAGFGGSTFEDAAVVDTPDTPWPTPPTEGDHSTADIDSAFNLDDLDLSTLSDEDLALGDMDDEDIFNLETLAQKAGVDLGELNNLLNQPDSTTTEGESTNSRDEDWGNLN